MSDTVKLVIKKKRRKEGGGGTRKYGRNKTKCARYRAEGRRDRNKARKQKKHLKMVAKKRARQAA